MKSFSITLGSLSSLLVLVGCLVVAGCSAGAGAAADDSSSEQNITSATECKGLLPHTCAVCSDGTTSCAHWVVVDDTCEIQICATPAKPLAPECVVAGDCKGPLPAIVVTCADGSTSGASHVCNAGKCAIQTCVH